MTGTTKEIINIQGAINTISLSEDGIMLLNGKPVDCASSGSISVHFDTSQEPSCC